MGSAGESGSAAAAGGGPAGSEQRARRGCVVVGVDRSAESAAALSWAGQEALLRGGSLRVVHATGGHGQHDEAAAILRDLLAGIRAPLRVAVDTVTVSGRPARALVTAGRGADLLVVGSHAAGPFAGVFTSVARHTAAFAGCPVAAVRSGQGGAGSRGWVAVGVEDSPASRAALSWAAAEALRRQAGLRVVHALVPEPVAEPGDEEAAAGQLVDYLLAQVLTGPLAGLRVDKEVRPEPPGRALLAASGQADLVVVGAHGHGIFSGALFGSATSDFLHSADCPAVVVPGAAESQRARKAEVAAEHAWSGRGQRGH